MPQPSCLEVKQAQVLSLSFFRPEKSDFAHKTARTLSLIFEEISRNDALSYQSGMFKEIRDSL